jgi:protease I
MAGEKLEGIRVAALATDDFEESELLEPKAALEKAGARVTVIAPRPGEIQAMKHDEKSKKIKVDKTLDQVSANDFDALLLPGGALNADQLRIEPKAQELAKAFDKAGKPIGVICHGPWLLVSAGLVKGRKLTSYHTIRDDMVNAGAEWTDQELVRDRNWISSRSPKDLPAFIPAIIEKFAGARRAAA